MKKIWRIWAKALGQKASQCDRESDYVAYVRSVFMLLVIVTNLVIIAGVWRHW